MTARSARTLALAGALLLTVSTEVSAETVEVTASALNVRTGPGTGYSRLGLTYRGQRHTVLGRSGSWVRLSWQGRAGWSYGGYLRTVAAPPAPAPTGAAHTVTASVLNVRSGPSTGYRIVGKLTRGARVSVVGSSGSWRKIPYAGRTAWVHGAYLTAASAPPPPPTSSPSPAAWSRTPPAADYRRKSFRGVTVNQRTIELILRAERIMADLGRPGFRFVLTQGSYTTSVSASAGTHGGGGAADLRTRDKSRSTVDAMVRALRRAGFAAWSRGRGFDSFSPHVHAIAIGDREATSSALSQVRAYAQGRNGLRNGAPDPDRHLGREAPQWAQGFLR